MMTLFAAWLFGSALLFGANTTCTNHWGCTVSDCEPCDALLTGFWVHTIGQTMAAASAVFVASRFHRSRTRWTTIAVWALLALATAAGYVKWTTWWLTANT